MKHKIFFLVVIFSLLLTAASGASALAVRDEPPEREHPLQGMSDEREWDRPEIRGGAWQSGAQPRGAQGSLVPTADLGQAGLSFAYERTFGVTEQPYLTDTAHLNSPVGLFIDGSNKVYVVEQEGARLLRYTAAGAYDGLSIGYAGMHNTTQDSFSWPNDVALDGDGNIWVVDDVRAVQFDSDGDYLQAYPANEDEWDCIEDNDHMCWPYGIAFDSSGRMYVSDMEFHRVQVYDFDISGTPFYSTTIGTSFDNSVLDNYHFNFPAHIALDSSDRLYVADYENHRIQRCEYATGWSCTTFHGTGVAGEGDDQLAWPEGVTVDSFNNVYIADTENWRLKKCDLAGACSIIAVDIEQPMDVAVDSTGYLFVASQYNSFRVVKYTSNGAYLYDFAGTYQVPYVPDTTRLHAPWGLAVDSAGNIYVTEERGHRLLKMNANGVQLWTYGQAGITRRNNLTFNHLRGNMAIDSSGRIYVPDQGRHRVQIFNADGTLYNTMGTPYEAGSDDAHFDRPMGVAISPLNGDIYVTDRYNHRVQVFYNNLQHKTTLGETGVPGDDDDHFDEPYGVAVDWSGNVYVADRLNNRVQKFNSSHVYQDTIGVTDVCTNSHDHLCRPSSVSVDRQGRVYIADTNRNRVQVFDGNGGYLTTIGGGWGTATGQLRSPQGVAVDSLGAVYVTDRENHRVQKYVPGQLGWTQRNLNGFGERENSYVESLASFNGQIYAGTYNWTGNGAQLWRSSDGLNWTPVFKNGFGDATNAGVDDLIEFSGKLYAGTYNYDYSAEETTGGQIWRSENGSTWAEEVTPPSLDPTNGEFLRLEAFENMLYAATCSFTDTHGAEIWRTSTGNSLDWTQVVADGLGNSGNACVISLTEYNGSLYAGTWNRTDGAEVWRSDDGSSWAAVSTGGFGDAYNRYIGGMEAFSDALYVGTSNYTDSDNPGAELWRCQDCDGSVGDWEMVPIAKGFGDTENQAILSLSTYEGDLFAFTGNWSTGVEAWRSSDGENWQQVNLDGFGSSNNISIIYDNAVLILNNLLYVGVTNNRNGGQIWMSVPLRTYLPIMMR